VEEIKTFEAKYALRLDEATKAEASREKDILNRVKDLLNDEKYTWRTIDILAFKSGVTKGEALDLLRRDPNVVFGIGKSGQIAKLKYRGSDTL